VLLTSHLLHQVQQTCDRMAIFVDGAILAEGTAPELAARLGDGQAFYEVVTGDTGGSVDSALEGVFDGAIEVRGIGGQRWHVAVPADEARRLVPALVDSGVDVREVRDLGSDLDEIYHRYFTEGEEVAV
jgi:ABC-2 type transport system ATP-binding protein